MTRPAAEQVRRIRLAAPLVAALSIAVLAPQAQAGVLITRDGIEITPPAAHQATRLGTSSGFRRFGRAGFFAQPVDPGLPFHGRFSYGAAGRKAWATANRDRRPRLPGDSIFTGAIWDWFD